MAKAMQFTISALGTGDGNVTSDTNGTHCNVNFHQGVRMRTLIYFHLLSETLNFGSQGVRCLKFVVLT